MMATLRTRFYLFTVTSFLSTATGLVCSLIVGRYQSWVGFLIGGAIGVLLSVLFARRMRIIDPASFLFALGGGLAGLEVGAAALFFIRAWPMIPIFSISMIGAGAMVGAIVKERGYSSQR